MWSVLNGKLGKEVRLGVLINFVLFYLTLLVDGMTRIGCSDEQLPSGRVWHCNSQPRN